MITPFHESPYNPRGPPKFIQNVTHLEFIDLWSAGKHLLLLFTVQSLINLSQNLVVLDMFFLGKQRELGTALS